MPTYQNYEALLYGVQNQVNSAASPTDPADTHPADPAHLLPHHLDLLIDLQQALVLRKSAPNDALAAWHKVRPALKVEIEAAKAEVEDANVDVVEKKLSDAESIFVNTAYDDAAQAHTHLEAPDIEQQKTKLEQAEKEFLEAKKLWESARNVMAGHVDAIAGASGAESRTQEIIELIALPGTIEEKLEWAKKKGVLTQAGTAVELVGKVKGACGNLLKLSATVGKRYCEGLAKQALSQGKKELAKELEEAAERWKGIGEIAEKLGTVANVLVVIGDGIELIDAIRNGNWEDVLSKTEDLAVDAAPLVLGADIAAPLAGVIVLFKAEMEVWHLAAEFIRWCKDEQVRDAAAKFVDGLSKHVYPWADRLATDVEIMLDGSRPPEVQAKAQSKVDTDAKNAWQGVKYVAGTYLGSSQSWQLGAHAAAFESLGSEAVAVFNGGDIEYPAEAGGDVIALAVLDKVTKIFHGANLMAKFVREAYTN